MTGLQELKFFSIKEAKISKEGNSKTMKMMWKIVLLKILRAKQKHYCLNMQKVIRTFFNASIILLVFLQDNKSSQIFNHQRYLLVLKHVTNKCRNCYEILH